MLLHVEVVEGDGHRQLERFAVEGIDAAFRLSLIDVHDVALPVGLAEGAVREAKEETGLDLEVLDVDPAYERPYFMTVGMVDECVGAVYGYASGEVTDKYLESSEEIEVVLADRKEARRILREERVAYSCAKTLMHFIHDEEPFAYLKEDI